MKDNNAKAAAGASAPASTPAETTSTATVNEAPNAETASHQAIDQKMEDAIEEAKKIVSDANDKALVIIGDAERKAALLIDAALADAEAVRKEAQIVLEALKAHPTNAPSQSAIGFATENQNTVANNPTYVEREIDGVKKKFLIRGKSFLIDGKDYTDTDLARDENTGIIDTWIANKSGVLEEVFTEE